MRMGTLTTMMLIMLPDYVDEDFAIGGYRQIAGCPEKLQLAHRQRDGRGT